MVKFTFKNPLFITSAVKAKDYPTLKADSGKELPEIAVAGRSNVGKSSLLNHLFQRHDLVKTSSVPGKTQLINFFTLDKQLVFVDLPGYGYAKVPEQTRKKWGPMIQEYLDKRAPLKLILFLFDVRRLPNEEDLTFMEWAASREIALILVITKVDKVTNNQMKSNIKKILEAFNCENLYYIPYSVTKNIGRKELVAMLNDALQEEEMDKGIDA